MTDPNRPDPPRRLRRRLRRWGGIALAALALLGLAQAMWWWESWSARPTIDTPVQAGVRG